MGVIFLRWLLLGVLSRPCIVLCVTELLKVLLYEKTIQNCKSLNGRGSAELLRTNVRDMLGGLMQKDAWVSSLTVLNVNLVKFWKSVKHKILKDEVHFFPRDINKHWTTCKNTEVLGTHTWKFTTFSYKTPIFHICKNTKKIYRLFSNWPRPHN